MDINKKENIRKKILDLVKVYSDLNFSEKNFIEGLTESPVSGKVIGALECAKLELYRRIAAPYEDTKIQENGEVYTKLVGD